MTDGMNGVKWNGGWLWKNTSLQNRNNHTMIKQQISLVCFHMFVYHIFLFKEVIWLYFNHRLGTFYASCFVCVIRRLGLVHLDIFSFLLWEKKSRWTNVAMSRCAPRSIRLATTTTTRKTKTPIKKEFIKKTRSK